MGTFYGRTISIYRTRENSRMFLLGWCGACHWCHVIKKKLTHVKMYYLFCVLSFIFDESLSFIFSKLYFTLETLHAIIFFSCCHDHVISLLSEKPLPVCYLLLLKLVLLILFRVNFNILVMSFSCVWVIFHVIVSILCLVHFTRLYLCNMIKCIRMDSIIRFTKI